MSTHSEIQKFRPASPRIHPEARVDQPCQGGLGSADAPAAEPRRAGSSRRAIATRKA
jgi:hypothetical protein